MLACRVHRDPNGRFLYTQVGVETTLHVFAVRDLEFDRARNAYVCGPWRRGPDDLPPGVYCAPCLAQEQRNRLTLDHTDVQLEGLDDPVLIFKDAADFKIVDVWEDLVGRFGDKLAAYRDFEPQPPVFADLGPHVQLFPELEQVLYGKVLPSGGRLYRHQAEALNAVYEGKDITIVTATASGKTLVYALPVIDSILKNPSATTLYLAPLNALVEDQLKAFSAFDNSGRDWGWESGRQPFTQYARRLTIGSRSAKIARYDGNVPEGERKLIRDAQPNVLITNPEMLHWGVLSWASGHWRYLFENLRFVVIDELHIYKGMFGSNFANLMRRLRRLCHYMGSSPQFICASATIKNPDSLAAELTGHKHTVIGQDRDGSPRRLRRFVLWDATRSDEAINTDASNLVAALVGEHRVKTITFARSIPSVDGIYRYVAARLRDTFGANVHVVKAFKKALTPEMKRQIAEDLRAGRLHGVISTTALQLGIDIGDLSAAVIVKYPGSIAQVWQQAGRAGRKGEGLIILMADRDPLNQYFAQHPDDFFAMSPEEVFVDADNKYIVLDQLWCAAKDWAIDSEIDKQFFGDSLPEYLTMLDDEGKVRRESARDAWVLRNKDRFPAIEVPIRAVGFNFEVIDDRGQVVANEDASRATRYLHKYARYSIQDDTYEVTDFDLDLRRKKGSAHVRRIPKVDYLTQSVSNSMTSIIAGRLKRRVFGAELHFGTVEFRSHVYAYYKIPVGGRGDRKSKSDFQPLGPAAPPERIFETTAAWLPLPHSLSTLYTESDFKAALHSMALALAMAVTIQEFCDPADIGGLDLANDPNTGLPTIWLHDTVPGGIGVAEQTYYDFENVFRRAYHILKDCPNAPHDPMHRGCPLCVTEGWGDESVVNRPGALEIMAALLGDSSVETQKSRAEIIAILESRGLHAVRFVKVGGMGEIYRGTLDGEERAIKVIKTEQQHISAEVRNRMVQEASIWHRLIHPHIVRLHEVNQPEGLFYLMLDWMPRGSLRDRLPAEGMAPKEARRIALGVARALAYLADQHLVHRDVNPNNILFDAADQPRLTDFGIAKNTGNAVTQQTQAGMLLGTNGYLPPEQMWDAARCDDRADVFALGVVMFEMLAGADRLPGRDTTGNLHNQALAVVQNTSFGSLLSSMLASDPRDRPSAAEVVASLSRWGEA